jgi:hypothetical protein
MTGTDLRGRWAARWRRSRRPLSVPAHGVGGFVPKACREGTRLLVALAAFAVAGAAACVEAGALPCEHRLEVELTPETSRLTGSDTITIQTDERSSLVFTLSERASVLRVEVNGKPRPYRFKSSELEVPIGAEERHRSIEVAIAYATEFNDPVPVAPLNTDNPGFGVTASITERGTFLLAGAGWYPDLIDGRDRFRLKVKAPKGVLAVTAGRCIGHTDSDEATVSEWQIENATRGLALSAAAYRRQERAVGDVTAVTYFTEANQDLADSYLEATAGYLRLYSDLFGAYPFPQFAVVENFFPTGYGFPSYTLLGSTVLRLPFIISTSLGHEIAHCWWGNGVYVDYEKGNWSEALTTYVSDYLYRERQSPAEAAAYRLQALRNYTELVPPGKDFPLARFMSRIDPATKAVGYDKGAMVFHMLRLDVGEEAFWGALRDIFRERLFTPTSWDDLRLAFERRAQRPLGDFFVQWVQRRGAPLVRLEDVKADRRGDTWVVAGRLVQEKPVFEAAFDLVLESAEGRLPAKVRLAGEAAAFEFRSASPPRLLTVDPDCNSLRRLDPAEVPPTVNSLKSSPATLIVRSGTAAENSSGLAEILARSLGLRNYAVIQETELDRRRLEGNDIVLIGRPRNAELLRTIPPGLWLGEDTFALDGVPGALDADTFFGVFRHPVAADRVVAVLLAASAPHAAEAAAKVTHYGRYSFLAFRQGRNLEKGTWPPAGSPVVHRFP